MKVKCRVTSLLTILAVSSLLVTVRVFIGLERNLRDSNSFYEVTTDRASDTAKITTVQAAESNGLLSIGTEEIKNTSPWDVWSSWVKPTKLYPIDSFRSSKMDSILSALSHYPIVKFKLGYRGTQLKTTMYLSGNQRTVFKPKRFSRDDIVDGPDNPYAGYDRHNGEIAAFHLDGILGLGLAPPVSGRRINLTKIIPLTEHKLKETYVIKNGDICFYGKCYYCKPTDLACSEDGLMEGSVTIWLPESHTLQTWRHPYQRTYVNNRKAKWETDENYCKSLLSENSKFYHLIPDIMDTAVFDYLIGNADRHHFETFSSLGQHGRLLHIDSGKSFGNPHHDEKSILVPLRQCCRLRNSTWLIIQSYAKHSLSKVLDDSLKRDVLYPILAPPHLEAIDRRLQDILITIKLCITRFGQDTVLFDTWK